jgi:hypothetical protein
MIAEKTELKSVDDLQKGEYIHLGGWRCIIKKVEIQKLPEGMVRLTIKILGATTVNGIVLLPKGMMLEVQT